ncbi:MAG: hypothetical protein JW839_19375 [Candidatus Lokiarchaeota archaeon]|nr:hypothetical protein [Candidatus Lokiarchaeota archaeon]
MAITLLLGHCFFIIGNGNILIDEEKPSTPPAANILPAASTIFVETFDSGTPGGYPPGWACHDNATGGTTVQVSSEVIDSGNSLQLVDGSATDNASAWRVLPTNVTAGIIEFNVRVKSSAVGSQVMQHLVRVRDGTNATLFGINMQQNITSNSWIIGVDGWLFIPITIMNTTYPLAEDTTYTVRAIFSQSFLVTLFVDNVLLVTSTILPFAVDRISIESADVTNGSTWLFDSFSFIDMSSGNAVPALNSPPDLVIPPGLSGRSITWTATDPDVGNAIYGVYQNGSLVGAGMWTSPASLSFSLPVLQERQTYNFTIVVFDGINATANDTVFVRTTANVPPAIQGLASVTFERGIGHGDNLTWTITDPSVNPAAATCQLRRNGTLLGTAPWTSGQNLQYNTTGMGLGTYNFTLTAADGLGNSTSFTTILTIVDDLPPRISQPPDITYQVDTTGNTLSWVVTDYNMTTGWYAIYKDGVLQSNTTWTGPSATVSINIDGLEQGGHTYEIFASDGRHTSRDAVNINVTNPLLDALIVTLVITGAAIAVVAVIAVRRRKKMAGTRKVKRKVPGQGTAKAPAHTPAPEGKAVTCPACGTSFTLTTEYVTEYAGRTFKCTKCQADIPI